MFHHKRVYMFLFLSTVLESSFRSIHFSQWMPHFGLIILIFVALNRGMVIGFCCGLWLGFLIALHTDSFQAMMIPYMMIGALLGMLRDKVFPDALISQLLLPAVAYLFLILVSALYQVEGGDGLFSLFLMMLSHSSFFITLASSPLIFLFCRRVFVGRLRLHRTMRLP